MKFMNIIASSYISSCDLLLMLMLMLHISLSEAPCLFFHIQQKVRIGDDRGEKLL